ncbi:tyrosine-type recombinase/integrase [Sagittula salina]|uniref:Site-specific integrase n=1 Tax=Sagittula salina TaxID=2820268 RepID=A0A940MWK0_9RHOB|nr:site-specific integrase [Sagittula salina]MBP0485217.1 site-specific integrase [Sagittula salina]
MPEMRLHDPRGDRLYLNAEERGAFLAAARWQSARDRTLCETLHWTGCRPSELIEVTPARVDLSVATIAIRSLKKRKDGAGRQKIVFRTVPVPPEFIDTLNTAHGIREAQRSRKKAVAPIWNLSRVRVWQIVKGVMIEAGIPDAPHRSPKGLRHGFGVHATVQGVPLHMLQRWLGHAQLSTTAIYADAVGREEQDIAARMWK